ncbi:S-layer homology domain-containing protein [Paenibacillus zeirhizosphaerae]
MIAAGAYHSLVYIAPKPVLDSSISPDSAVFDKNESKQADIHVTLTLNGNTFAGIQHGGTPLNEGTDYTVDGNMVTIAKAYLAALDTGSAAFTFTFSAGAPQSLEVEVMDSTVAVPSAPMNVSAAAGNGEAVIRFTAPASDGGSAVTGYKVVSSPGGIEASGEDSPITVKGLTNGTSYTFTVQAENSAGWSTPSAASNAVTPAAPSSGGGGSSRDGDDDDDEDHGSSGGIGGGSSGGSTGGSSSDGGSTGTGSTPDNGANESGSTAESGTEGASFSDVTGHWAETNIIKAVQLGIVNGYPDGTFEPDATITRAEFARMLINALKPEVEGAALTFSDQDQIGDWAYDAVKQSVALRLVSGYEDGSFRPGALITRAELAVMVARAAGMDSPLTGEAPFADDSQIPSWAKAAVYKLSNIGIVNGRSGNRFEPRFTATRAEAVTMLLRWLQFNNN